MAVSRFWFTRCGAAALHKGDTSSGFWAHGGLFCFTRRHAVNILALDRFMIIPQE